MPYFRHNNSKKRQKELLQLVKNNQGCNTHQLAQLRGDRQAYETYLRDRLFTLVSKGKLRYEEVYGECGFVIQRCWYITE